MPATCPYPEPDQFSACLTSHLLKIHFNIFLPSKPGSLKWHLSLMFLHLKPEFASLIRHKLYMPPNLILLNFITR